jgi:pimeloyl-ACP methyl ester carboxylesterase
MQIMAGDSATGRTLTLKDGRILGYAEYGGPAGTPVIGFHGTPGSRLVMKSVEKAAVAVGAHIIAPDRPGYGMSLPNPNGTLLGYVGDMIELADALKLDRFAVLGVSGGAPYPLACAYKIPRRITVAALVSGIGPLSLPNSTHDMVSMNRMVFALGRLSPRLTGLALPWIIGASLRSMDKHAQENGSPSADMSSDVYAIVAADQREAIRAGGQSVTLDMKVLWKPWGFQFEDIHTQVYLWHGAADNLAPPALARYMAGRLPTCKATFYPDEDHTGPLTKHIDEIMAMVVRASQSALGAAA